MVRDLREVSREAFTVYWYGTKGPKGGLPRGFFTVLVE